MRIYAKKLNRMLHVPIRMTTFASRLAIRSEQTGNPLRADWQFPPRELPILSEGTASPLGEE